MRKRSAAPPSQPNQAGLESANGISESIFLFGQVGSLSRVLASQRAGSSPLSLAIANRLVYREGGRTWRSAPEPAST